MIGWVGGVGCRPFFGEILLLRFHPVHGCFIVTSPYGHPGPRAGGREGRGGKDERGEKLLFKVPRFHVKIITLTFLGLFPVGKVHHFQAHDNSHRSAGRQMYFFRTNLVPLGRTRFYRQIYSCIVRVDQLHTCGVGVMQLHIFKNQLVRPNFYMHGPQHAALVPKTS